MTTIPRAAAMAATLAMSLLLVAPASGVADDIDNYWNGAWNSHHEGTHGMTLYLVQQPGSREVGGSYSHPGDKGGDRGSFSGYAGGKYGKTLTGTYKSRKGGGRGGYKIKLLGDQNSFTGEFWPCRYRWYCSVYDWTGTHA